MNQENNRLGIMEFIGLGIVAGVVIAAFLVPTKYVGYGLLLGAALGAVAYYYNPHRQTGRGVTNVRPEPSNRETKVIDLIAETKK